MIFFTSDTHFNHDKVIEYCKRPFKSVDEMNEALITNWNERVHHDDLIYHLGDFGMGDRSLLPAIVSRLNGHKILVRGNHDKNKEKMIAAGFFEVYNSILTLIDGKRVWMQHIPVGNDPYQDRPGGRSYPPELVTESREHDVWLCGHVHEKFSRRGNVINVGVDVREFKPATFDELINSE